MPNWLTAAINAFVNGHLDAVVTVAFASEGKIALIVGLVGNTVGAPAVSFAVIVRSAALIPCVHRGRPAAGVFFVSADGEGLRRDTTGIDRDDRTCTCARVDAHRTPVGDVRATRVRSGLRGRVGGGGAMEGSTIGEAAADGENNAHGHGGGQDSGHGGDDGLDGVCSIGRSGDEPEEHVRHVDDPDRTVEVEAVAEHEFPGGNLLDILRLPGPSQGEQKGGCIEGSGKYPISTDPLTIVELGPCNAALTRERRRGRELEWHWSVEATGDGHRDNLETEQGGHAIFDDHAIWVNGTDTDDMDQRAERDEYGGTNRLEQVETVALGSSELGVKESNSHYGKFDRHKQSNEVINNLKERPPLHTEEPPCARREDQGVPCRHGERAHEEILVCAQVGGKVERRWQQRRDIWWTCAGVAHRSLIDMIMSS
jgi:hypothetical protein